MTRAKKLGEITKRKLKSIGGGERRQPLQNLRAIFGEKMPIPKGALYKSIRTGTVYEYWGGGGRTPAEQEARWHAAFLSGVNNHDYKFLDQDWQPGLFDDQNEGEFTK